jgi:hypothetical protein
MAETDLDLDIYDVQSCQEQNLKSLHILQIYRHGNSVTTAKNLEHTEPDFTFRFCAIYVQRQLIFSRRFLVSHSNTWDRQVEHSTPDTKNIQEQLEIITATQDTQTTY